MRRPRRLLAALLALASLAAACSYETKDFDDLFGEGFSVDELETAQSSRIVDRNGVVITDLRGEQNRTDVEFEDIPELVYNAVVAIEDERFWDHAGIDLKAVSYTHLTMPRHRMEPDGRGSASEEVITPSKRKRRTPASALGAELRAGRWTNSECLTGNLLELPARSSLLIERSSLERR